MTTRILIDPDRELAEDNVKLFRIKRDNEIVSGYRFVKEKDTEKILIHTLKKDFVPQMNSAVNLKLKIKAPLKKVKEKLKKFKFRDKYNKIILLDKDHVQNYRELIQVVEEIKSENNKCILLVNWKLNDFEKYLLNKFQYVCVNRKAWNFDGRQLILTSSVKFLSRHMELSIVHIRIVRSELHKVVIQFNDLVKEINLEINNLQLVRVFFPGISLEDTKYSVDSGHGLKNYEWGDFLGNKIPIIKNVYVIVTWEELKLEQISYLINDNFCVLTKKDEINMRQQVRVDLPGSLYPVGEINFEDEILRVTEGGNCVLFRTNGSNKIEIHKCHQKSCTATMNQELKFINPKGLFPITMLKIPSQKRFKKNIGIMLPPYTKISGGVVSLYKLRDLLEENGYNVNVLQYHPEGNFTYNHKSQPVFRQEPATDPSEYPWIYGDTIASLPFLIENQIQWQLNKPGYLEATSLGGYPIKPKYTWVYSAVFDETNNNKLFINNYDFEFFDPKLNLEKNFNSIYFGKKSFVEYHKLFSIMNANDYYIKRDFPPRENLPDLLTASRMLISLDPVSAINIEANLCGTPTLILLGENSYFQESDIRRFELPTNGLFFDLETIESAPDLGTDFRENFVSNTLEFERSTQEKFLEFLENI